MGKEIRIGVAAPLSGSTEMLGREILAGARAAAEKTKGPARIIEAGTDCSADGGKAAAERLAKEKATVVVGFLCTAAIEAALPILKEAGIPTLDVGVRANRLTDRRERTGALVWRIAPRSDAEAKEVAKAIESRWNDQPFGLVDDGSIAARNLVDSVRSILAQKGIKPQAIDTYRPAEEKQFGIARRLKRTGITRFFIAGDRPDIATIIRDAGSLGLALEVLGGEDLLDEERPDLPLAEGVLAVAPLNRFPDLAQEPVRQDEDPAITDAREPQGYFGPAFVATEIAAEAIDKAAATGRDLRQVLDQERFATSLGSVSFDRKGDSNLDLFRTFRWDASRFVPADDH